MSVQQHALAFHQYLIDSTVAGRVKQNGFATTCSSKHLTTYSSEIVHVMACM